MDEISTQEAAERLGVSARRVRALIERGDLAASRLGRVHALEPEALARWEMTRAPGRSLSARMSWVALLSDLGTHDLDELADDARLSRTERARVLALRGRTAKEWTWLARRRATTVRSSIRETYLERLLADRRIVRSGVSAVGDHAVDLVVRRGSGEVYVREGELPGLVDEYLLRTDPVGALVIHVVDESLLLGRFGRSSFATTATVGVDLAESEDVRTRRAGYDLLEQLRGN